MQNVQMIRFPDINTVKNTCGVDGVLVSLSDHYLSDILVALFDVFCGAHNQLMNTVYLRFLLQQ